MLVAAKIGVRREVTAAEVAEGIDAIEARIRSAVPIARVIYLEPDIKRVTPAGAAASVPAAAGE